MTSVTDGRRTHASWEVASRSTRREVLLSCNTEESGVAVPWTTVQSWFGFWNDAWNRTVLAWASDAISRRQRRQNARRRPGKLARQKQVLNVAQFREVSMGVLAVRQDFITKRDRK